MNLKMFSSPRLAYQNDFLCVINFLCIKLSNRNDINCENHVTEKL